MPRPTRTHLLATGGAALTTAGAVALGVLVTAPASTADRTSAASVSDAAAVADLVGDEERTIGTSRSTERAPALQLRVPDVERTLWTTAPLKLRVQPREQARSAGTFDDVKRIGVTGKRTNGYAEVVVDDTVRWVSARYLAAKKPKPEPATGAAAGVDTSPCGKSASGGLQPSAQLVMNAVCHAFPDITTYGGAAGRGEHGTGLAIDIMVSGARGEQVKQFLYANASQFNLSNIIWAQTIWSAERSGEGFRGMEDRGSTTANHYDHVHVLVNG
ncbi:M15 family metallopeptidase domain-containing protein [Nocardioides marmoraquaticus]